jgi:O-antigen/teichoic acid export membrane protein
MSEGGSRGHSLVRNTVAQSAPRMLGYILSFASAPVVVNGLGLRQFGIWALTGALAQYGALLDLGIGRSLSRYIAAHDGDRRLCGEYMGVGFLSVLVVGFLLAVATALFAATITRALHGISIADMRVVLGSSVVLLCCSMLASVVAAYPIGRRRMVTPNLGLAIGATVNFVASVGSILAGAQLPGYALANAAAGIATVLIITGLVLGVEGRIPIGWPNAGRARVFVWFSVKNQMVRVMDLVNYQSDKVVIAFSVGPAAAGAYELANRVALAGREAGIWAASAVDIELTSMLTRSGIGSVRRRYGRLTEVAVAFAFPPLLLSAAVAPLLFDAWLSQVPPDATAVLVALSLAYVVTASTGVGYGVASAAGNPGVVAQASVGTAILNIVLTVSLAPLFGIWGILAGTVVALSSGALVQALLVHRRFELSGSAYRRAVAPALGAYALLAVPVAALAYAGLFHGRVVEAVVLIVLAVLYLGSCGRWVVRSGRLPVSIRKRLGRRMWLQAPT